jgi:hypothetical protein
LWEGSCEKIVAALYERRLMALNQKGVRRSGSIINVPMTATADLFTPSRRLRWHDANRQHALFHRRASIASRE